MDMCWCVENFGRHMPTVPLLPENQFASGAEMGFGWKSNVTSGIPERRLPLYSLLDVLYIEKPCGKRSVVMSSTAVLVVIVIVAFYLFSSIKILKEYERGVVFRLGRLL